MSIGAENQSRDPELSKERNRIYKSTYTNKNPEEARKKNLEYVQKSQNIQKEQNPEEFRNRNKENVVKSQTKMKEQNPEEFTNKNLEHVVRSQKRKKEQSPEGFRIQKKNKC